MTARIEEIIVDAHAHLHPRFDAGTFLDAAAANAGGDAVLCFTESAGVDRFGELWASKRAGAWTLATTNEPESLHAQRGHTTITLLAGRQVITAERIEVLALARVGRFPDGAALGATIDAVQAAGAIPVLPWGFGKWWGGRGRLVEREIRTRSGVFVGDQAGRPRGSIEHRVLRVARERSVPVLPGSDPLNMGAHVVRAASFGFTLRTPLDPSRPAADFRERVRALASSPPVAGRRVGWPTCLCDQVAVRLAKRSGARA